MNEPLLVEVIVFAPTDYQQCSHCEVSWHETGLSSKLHEELRQSSLPPDLIEQYQVVLDWVEKVIQRYPENISVRIIDAASPEGLLKSIRHWTRKYPAVILDHEKVISGGRWDDAESEIAKLLSPARSILEKW